MFVIFSVFYILVAAAMTVLILMQRGQGASAGASFGGGSSGTMFGARGSASFMSRATGALFAVFIIMSLGMAIYLTHAGAPRPSNDLGIMSGVSTTTNQNAGQKAGQGASAAGKQVPAPAKQQPATAVPQATQPATSATSPASPPATTGSDVPTATPSATQAANAGTTPTGARDGSSGSGKK